METTIIIIAGIAWIIFVLIPFTKKTKLDKTQDTIITSISKELNIPKEEVLWVFIEMGNTFMILSQEPEEGNKKLARDIDKRGHLKEYRHWKEIAKIVHESFYAYLKNNPEK